MILPDTLCVIVLVSFIFFIFAVAILVSGQLLLLGTVTEAFLYGRELPGVVTAKQRTDEKL